MRFWLDSGRSFRFCSLVYSGGLSRDLNEIFHGVSRFKHNTLSLEDQVVREFVISSKASKEYLLLIKEPNNEKTRRMAIAQTRWMATWEGRLQHCLVGQVSYMWSLLGQN
ncbi:hypothetical protein GQ457_14G015800 [Hibiscus cannabinus]